MEIKHKMDWQGYAKNSVSSWPDAIGQDLVNRGLATIYTQPKEEAPVRRGIADKMIKKGNRAKK